MPWMFSHFLPLFVLPHQQTSRLWRVSEFCCPRRAQPPSLCGRRSPTTHLLDLYLYGHSRPSHFSPAVLHPTQRAAIVVDEGSRQVLSTARRIITLVVIIYCPQGRSLSIWNLPLETLGMRGFFFFFFSCWGIWNERAKGDYNTCAFARAIHPSLYWSLHGDGGFFARTPLFIFKLPW